MLNIYSRRFLGSLLSAAILLPNTIYGYSSAYQLKSVDDIKLMISAPSSDKKTDTGRLIVISLLASAAAGTGGFYGGSFWQKVKMNRANEIVIQNLKNNISLLASSLKIEQEEHARTANLLNQQTELFNSANKAGAISSAREVSRAEFLGFNRGYDAAFVGSEELREVYEHKGFQKGYAKKATEEFLKGQEKGISTALKTGGFSAKNKEADIIIQGLTEEMEALRVKLLSMEELNATNKEILSLIAQGNKNLFSLEYAKYAPESERIEKILMETTAKLAKVKAYPSTQKLIADYIECITRKIQGHGGILGIGAAVVIGGGIILASSSDASAANVSHARLEVSRRLKSVFAFAPEAFAAQVFLIQEAYGTELTASVLYEHQEFLPLLEMQISLSKSKEVKDIFNALNGATAQADKKQQLLNSLAGNR